ncbi:flagellar hook-basal body protein FliE [Rubripirellula tenax]|uniref:Flagellar hook-basal body complex protein FliE n=1 Tax=Rubripirellula tenax TaxID=2528015 RepID=A0A5C6ES20_9BACT|nr:flagellar hook-basal body complex protein FliE [Rubripirellula tenax]TWU50897.1 flagellar hook-basal body protein FliE [Rubripirellula tenax]
MRPIAGIQPPARPASPFGPLQKIGTGPSPAGASGIDSFANLLGNQVKSVNTMQVDANEMVHTMLTGGNVNEAEVLTSVQKADLAFRMLLQVRNKLLEAYREVQQIQI